VSPRVTVYDDRSERWALIGGDALELLGALPQDSVDAVICDPPYNLDFHDEPWDGKSIRATAPEIGPNAAFAEWTRRWAAAATSSLKPGGHLLAFGSPRTFHRLVSGIEDAGFEVRDQVLWVHGQGIPKSRRLPGGRGTQLKPAFEPILIARKPLTGTTAQNVERFGTGTLNVDAARVGLQRYWPANLALSHHPDCPVALLDHNTREPSRLFYSPKASPTEREAGCEELAPRATQIYQGASHPVRLVRNHHPTVKPVDLMRWLVRLAVPDGATVLDPFCGSGTTGIAAIAEGRRFVGIERREDYLEIACARLAHAARERA